ncbi:MAG: protein kinase, partial [Xanthomonadales bacterium]|nr:protein kinase [Xanthomonadales bacterium]
MDPEIAPESWPRLRNAFEHALDLSPAQRGPWLAAELADAPTLLLAAERMLDELDSADSPLERVAQSTRGLEPSPGQWVGTQRLLRRIGVGGMGEIWEAERVIGEDRQQVAVKLLAFGSGPAFAQRLDAERRVLARLNHPNICTLLDAGVDQLGRPYLALEYVEGETFTQWCYDRAVDLDARLALLLEVCDAVAYAHAHLVVHRDLKPANVLVGASGRVKLLDFGIAKMLDAGDQPSGATRMLTPAYASPEQARGLGVTTATDIYALGVLLYELVCEKAPYQLDGLAQDQLIDRLLNPLHPPASQVLKRGGRRRLAGRVADGLDAVIGKAMNPDPERRYQSVAALAEDLRRWGAGHPVQARPDHWSYRLRCFVRRHSLATSLALVTVVLVSGFGYALWQRYQAEKIALVEAQRERALSNQVSDFLVELFSSADPDSTDPDRVDLKILLDRGSDALLHGSINDPELAAGLAARIARVYASLGLYAEADQLLDGVQPASSVALSSARQADLAEARALSRFGSGDSAAAVALLRSALA